MPNNDPLYSIRLSPQKDMACIKLREVLLEKKLMSIGPKGKISRWALLEYLIDSALDTFTNDIFPPDPSVPPVGPKNEIGDNSKNDTESITVQ